MLKRTFPMVAGAISASQQAICYVNDLSATVQAQLNTLREGSATANSAINSRYANSASTAAYLGGVAAATYARLDLTNSFSVAQVINGTLDISAGTSQPLRLKTSSAGPWALELLRTDTGFSSRVYNNGTGWQFEHSPFVGGAVVLTTSSTLNPTQLNSVPASSYARLDSAQSFSKGQAITQVNSSGTSLAPNCDDGTMFRHVINGTTSIAAPTAPRSGMVISIHLIQGNSGGWTAAWSSAYHFAGGTAPTLSISLSAVDVFAFQYDSTSAVWRQAGLNVR